MIDGFSLPSLQSWMDSIPAPSGAIRDIEPLAGGSQNLLFRFRKGAQSFVLRRPSLLAPPNAAKSILREARLLSALNGSTVPHARLVAQCDDPAIIGSAFYIMDAVEGFTATVEMPALHRGSPKVRNRMGLAIIESSVALADIDYDAVGLSDFGKPDGYLTRQVDRWDSQFQSYEVYPDWTGPGSLPDVEAIANWLRLHRPNNSRPGLIHGDFHIANIMFRRDNAEIAAIIDWELSTIGDPLIDLGWLLVSWQEDGPVMEGLHVEPWDGFPTRAELVAHYRALSSRDLSALDWYEVFAAYKFAIILEGTNARASAGKADPAVAARLHDGAVRLLNRALTLIH